MAEFAPARAADATTVVQLLNMITEEDLKDPEEYEDLCDDVREECGKYGVIKSMKIPRPSGYGPVPGVGKVFLEYASTEDAGRAAVSLSGRRFASRTVVSSFFDPLRYHNGQLD